VVGDGPLEHRQTIVISSHVNAFYFLPATNELKVVFPDDEATLIPALTMDPATLTILPKRFDNYTYTDDVNDARIWFIVQPSGELFLVEPPAARKLWAFAPGTWVRSSADGRAYAAIVPGPKGRGMGDGVSVWLALVGADPVQVGSMRACLPGDDRDEVAEISADARVAVVKRCGAMAVFTRGHEPREITSAERVGVFHLSRDGRWLVVSRSGAVELLDLVSGATRELAGGSTVALADVSPDHAWVFSSGGDHGTRVWPLATDSAVGILGELAAPARIVIPETGQLAILRHLECSHWSTSERAITQRFGATPVQARDLDSEEQLWPQAISADGHACVFAGQNGVAIVATDDGATHVLPGKPELLTCVLAPDGKRATCETKAGLVAFDVATGVRGAARATPEDAKLRGLVMYRGAPVALVSRATGCTLESPDGTVIAKLAGGGDCRQLRTSGATHPGDETALLVDRPAGVEVWTADGDLSVPSESGVVDVSAKGLVAVARDQAIEIWDRRLHARRGGPALHGHAVELLAWSPLEILAAVDDETIRLWDPAADVTRVIYAPHTIALAWSRDGKSLFTTDGHTIATWPVEVRRGATPQEVRARLDALTSAEIVDGRVATP
jgi:WD40 repeat protein